MKQIDMSVFVGQDFDCEFFGRELGLKNALIGQLSEITKYGDFGGARDSFHPQGAYRGMYEFCRPRLNKPQVLDDYSFLPRGFQYVIRYSNYKILNGAPVTSDVHQWESLHNMIGNDNYDIEWVMIIGVTEEYREWGESVGMKVIE